MKISVNAIRQFEYFASHTDTKVLPPIEFTFGGVSALESFHSFESTGRLLPTIEPVLLSRALNGKRWHGLTVKMIAEDLIDCLITKQEVKSNYPLNVAEEIFKLAAKLALTKIGFVPSYAKP